MGVAAPVIQTEMNEWVALGGGNSGIVGNSAHTYGFHVAADELPVDDYSRRRDPNGSDGPYINWDYACAGDFSHKNDENLRAMHRAVLARLMRGELPMICEFIGKPWADQPVYYWARWNGVGTLQRYTGSGHDHWSHISWYRSMVDQRARLWVPQTTTPPPSGSKSVAEVASEVIRGEWGNGSDRRARLAAAGYNYDEVQAEVNRQLSGVKPTPPPPPTPSHPVLAIGDVSDYTRRVQMFFRNNFPAYSDYVWVRRGQLINIDGVFGLQTDAWVKEFQRRVGITKDGVVGPNTLAQLRRFGYKY